MCRRALYCNVQSASATVLAELRGHRSGMKTAITIRVDAVLLDAVRQQARQENRSLTNLIETALKERIAGNTGAMSARTGSALSGKTRPMAERPRTANSRVMD